MRHIHTVSIDTDLESELDEYQKSKGNQTRSKGAIQLLRKGLQYDSKIEELKAENENLMYINGNKVNDEIDFYIKFVKYFYLLSNVYIWR